jgi:hypothetical protein
MPIQPIKFTKTTNTENVIDYEAFTSSLTKAVDAGLTTIETQKKDIIDAQQEVQKVYDANNALARQNGDYLSERVVKLGQQGSLGLQEMANLYASQKITPQQWLTYKNNVTNSATQMTSFIEAFAKSNKEAIEGQAPGSLNENTGLSERGTLDAYNQDKLGAISQLKGHGFSLADDGSIFFSKYKEDGTISDLVGDYKTMPAALNASLQVYKNFDLEKNLDNVGDNIKPVIKVSQKAGISTLEDAWQSEDVQAYVDNEWNQVASSKDALISIITMQGVEKPLKPDGKTRYDKWDVVERRPDGKYAANEILIETDPTSDRFVPVTEGEGSENYQKAVKLAKDVYEKGIRARLGLEEKPAVVKTKSTTKADYDNARLVERQNLDIGDMFRIVSGQDMKVATGRLQKRRIKPSANKEIIIDDITRTQEGGIVINGQEELVDAFGGKQSKLIQKTIDIYERDDKGEIDVETMRPIDDVVGEIFSSMYGYSANPEELAIVKNQFIDTYGSGSDKQILPGKSYSETLRFKQGRYENIGDIEVSGVTISPSAEFAEALEPAKIKEMLPLYNQRFRRELDAKHGMGGFEFIKSEDGLPPKLKFKIKDEVYITDIGYFKPEDKDEDKLLVPFGVLENVFNAVNRSGNKDVESIPDVTKITK